MELRDAVAARRMVRAFEARPVEPALIDELCDLARRAPSAGNTRATSFVVLEGPDQVARYWDASLPAERRDGFRWPGLLEAPVLVVVVTDPDAYPARYAEPDKAATGLGEGTEAWAVPYWWVDAGAAAEHLLLGAVDAGLGACLFGAFDHEPAVAAALGIPEGHRIVAAVAIGHPRPSQPGRSAGRPGRPRDQVVRRGGW